MRLRNPALLLVPLALLLALPLVAGEADEATLDILASTLRANRKAMVAVNLSLEDAEAEAFWPVYDRYDAERSEIRERQVAIIEDYTTHFGSLADDKAAKLVEDYLAVQAEQVGLRQRYLESFSAVLPARKVMRFYQIDNKIEAVLRYELARTIPVVEQ